MLTHLFKRVPVHVLTAVSSLLVCIAMLLVVLSATSSDDSEVTMTAGASSEPMRFRMTELETTTTHPPSTTTTAAPTTTTTAPPPPPTTTTVPPSPQPAPAAAEPRAAGSCGGWQDTIAAYFPPEQVATACRVMMCESGGNPSAHNPSGASGLFQIMPGWADEFASVTGQPYYDGVYNGDLNTKFAAWLQSSGGWQHWACW